MLVQGCPPVKVTSPPSVYFSPYHLPFNMPYKKPIYLCINDYTVVESFEMTILQTYNNSHEAPCPLMHYETV